MDFTRRAALVVTGGAFAMADTAIPAAAQPEGNTMIINDPATKAEVEAAFARYEKALGENEVAVLDELFWDSPNTIRYGIGENLYGYKEVAAFRSARPAAGLARTIDRTVITTFGKDYATASTLFQRGAMKPGAGRQMQTWARIDGKWRIVAAHVSVIKEG